MTEVIVVARISNKSTLTENGVRVAEERHGFSNLTKLHATQDPGQSFGTTEVIVVMRSSNKSTLMEKIGRAHV